MVDQGGAFSFFQGIYVRTDIRIDISISIRGVDSNEINQARAGDIVTSRSLDKLKPSYLHYHSDYGHQTWQDGD